MELIKSISADNGRFVANAHTLIKIAQVIMLFPFTGWLVKMTYLIVPGEDQKVGYRESYQLKYIGDKVVFNPATAVVEVIKELERMASLAEENLNRAMNALITLDEEDIEEVYEVEKNINFLNHAITDYLVKINQTTLPIEDLNSLGALFHVVNDIERIGDHAENVADAARQRKEEGVSISKEAQKELGDMLEMVNKIIRYAVEMFAKSDESHMQEIVTLEDQVDEKERELQKKHVERLDQGRVFSRSRHDLLRYRIRTGESSRPCHQYRFCHYHRRGCRRRRYQTVINWKVSRKLHPRSPWQGIRNAARSYFSTMRSCRRA